MDDESKTNLRKWRKESKPRNEGLKKINTLKYN